MIALADPPTASPTIAPVTGQWPSEQYVTVRDVPIFAEHRTKARDGRMLQFGPHELQAVADRCNRRISETGDYAVISVGHTPDPEQRANGTAADPEVVGFAGPFHVDRIGGNAARPRFAILADLHYFNDPAVLEKVRRHPRRSPELWLEDSYAEMFLDPIALLGAEAPRLDMGLFYAAVRNGRQIEKYQAAAAASPAAGNVFVPDEKYQFDQPGQPNTENQAMPMSPDEVKQIVDAIMQTDTMRWVQSKMQEEIAANTSVPAAPNADVIPDASLPPSVDAPSPAGSLAPEVPAGGPSGALPGSADAPLSPGNNAPSAVPPAIPPVGDSAGSPTVPVDPADSADQGDIPKIPDDEDEDVEEYRKWRRTRWASRRKKKYSADADADTPDSTAPATGKIVTEPDGDDIKKTAVSKYRKPGVPVRPERNVALEAELVQLRGQVERYQKDLESERATRTDADRYSKLLALRQRYVFDMDREYERCKYGRMNDGQFAEFAGENGVIEANFQPIPLGAFLPTFEPPPKEAIPAPGANGNPEKYSREQSEKAYRYCEARRIEGKDVDYMETLTLIREGKPLPE